MNQEQLMFKVVLVGGTNVGKTCIAHRATGGAFEAETRSTLGASYTARTVPMKDNTEAKLQIWDTAGQERFRGIAPMYYHGAGAALIVYSITDRESYEQVDFWLNSLRENTPCSLAIFLIGNKADLEEKRQVTFAEGQSRAQAIGAQFFEVSAKTGSGIEEVFCVIPTAYLQINKRNDATPPTETLSLSTNKKTKRSCC